MRQTMRSVLTMFILLTAAACSRATVQSLTATTVPSPPASNSPLPATTPSASTGISNLSAIQRVVQDMQPSVVRISVSGAAPSPGPFGRGGATGPSQAVQQGTGTGMVLDNQGNILTNNHVISLGSSAAATSVSIDLPSGRTASARVVGTDPLTDLAVIQVGSGDRAGLQPIQWADPNSIVVGGQVVAIGYALGLGGAPTVTAGIVSAVDRSIPVEDATIGGTIQTDASINQGNSGGPLLDLNGKVIGVNTAGLVGSPTAPVQGLSFAVSVQTAQPVAQALISQGHVTRGYLGVGAVDVTPRIAQANNLGVTSGAGVGRVSSDSPAAQAGLQTGDVITKVGDVNITTTGDLTNALMRYGPGQAVPVTYYRNKSPQTTTITLAQRPAAPTATPSPG